MSWLFFIASSLAVISVVSAGCSPPQWITLEGHRVASSTPDANGNANVSTCQETCLSKLNCVAIDYNDGENTCYLVSDASEATVEDAAFNHYTAQRTCEANGITCVYKSIGQYEFEGEIYSTSGARTIDDCVAGCTNSSCSAFAWQPFGTYNCIKTSEPISNAVNATIYTALEKTDCTENCQPHTWTKEANKVSADNVRTTSGDESAFACQLKCLATGDCVSIDYKTTGTECYIQTNAAAALSDQTGTDHYTISQQCYKPPAVSCSNPQWIKSEGMKIAGSVAAPAGDASVTACQGACLQLLNCTGIDYTSDNKCLLSYNTMGPLVADTTTDHYSAQRTCTAGGITCVYKSAGAYQFSGEIYSTTYAHSIDNCVAGCTESSCTGFAWSPFGDFKCIKTSESTDDKTDSQIYTLLVKSDCTGNCKPHTWTSQQNKQSAGRVRNSLGDESAFACQLQCLATEGCVAIDYTSSKECYTQTNENAALTDETGTTFYKANQDCTSGPNGAMATVLGNKWLVLMEVISLLLTMYCM